MKIHFRSILSCLILSATVSTAVCAQEFPLSYRDGYEDGYDDAMEDCPCPPFLLPYALSNGFYLGAGGGYEGFQISRSPLIWDEGIGRLNTHANGWNGRIFGGYGHFFHQFYLGGEIFGSNSSADGADSINYLGDYYGRFSVGKSIGASILPGFRLTETSPLVYGRIGMEKTDFTVYDQSGNMRVHDTNWTSGFSVGAGIEMPLPIKGFSARLEYDYIKYSSFYNDGWVGSRNSPSDNRGTLDIKYRLPF
jgi:hypothetical protein